MFINQTNFTDFKNISQRAIKYTFKINSDKTFTVVLKGLIFPEAKICENIKNQGLNLILCLEYTPDTYDLQNHFRPRNYTGPNKSRQMRRKQKFTERNTKLENA